MKIRRFVAKDMRTALEQIKHELGADAVIMSNKKIPEGVELMAAVDYNQQVPEAAPENPTVSNKGERELDSDRVTLGSSSNSPQVSSSMSQQAAIPTSAAEPENLAAFLQQQKIRREQGSQSAPVEKPSNIEQQLKDFTDRLEQGMHSQQPANIETVQTQVADNEQEQFEHAVSQRPASVMSNSEEMEQMRREMSSIRQLLEHQISGLMWQDMAQKDPAKALMVNRLMKMGLNEEVADQVASYLPRYQSEEEAWDQAKKLIASQLNTTNNEIIHRGGVVSLVGPTGVGKTTTVAKLAARFAQIHGPDQVALISTDTYRIGGFEQLTTYGRIIGCQVKQAKDAESLDALLQQFSSKKLVLIDTAGMGQRDMRLTEHLTTLFGQSRVRIRNYLVLSANTQQRVMQENVDRFKKIPLAGCIYTKLDESLSVGELIATSIQNGLAIGYLTDGQRVPEDIKVANAEKLVTLADKLATRVNHQDMWRPMPTSFAAGM